VKLSCSNIFGNPLVVENKPKNVAPVPIVVEEIIEITPRIEPAISNQRSQMKIEYRAD